MKPSQVHKLTLNPFATMPVFSSEQSLISIGATHSANDLILLTATKPLDFRTKNGVFTKIRPASPQTYHVYLVNEYGIKTLLVPDQSWNFHYAQILPDDEILLVCARSRYRGRDDYDLNGHVYDKDGVYQRSFLLGDGIEDVQVTPDGAIWTSYFDEGVFGNYGWDDPVGSPGLIMWDNGGEKIYSYMPKPPLRPIFDCYALNVVSRQDAWCCYYDDFSLVQIQSRSIKWHWKIPVEGTHTFSIWHDLALFQGGYNDRENFYLFRLNHYNHEVQPLNTIQLLNEDGDPFQPDRIKARGHRFYFVKGQSAYKLDVETVLELV